MSYASFKKFMIFIHVLFAFVDAILLKKASDMHVNTQIICQCFYFKEKSIKKLSNRYECEFFFKTMV